MLQGVLAPGQLLARATGALRDFPELGTNQNALEVAHPPARAQAPHNLCGIASPDWTTHCPVFLGQRCTIDIDECVSKPCLNRGLCHNTQGSYMCECPPGFSGMDCEEDIDDCLASEYASQLLSPGAQESTREAQKSWREQLPLRAETGHLTVYHVSLILVF